ncbi:MAG: hypothetical protein U9N73_00615 [Candidatus Auribacterota bacterium]|nr:hypothetical protein [Candidatus Auribacterota bacterium]
MKNRIKQLGKDRLGKLEQRFLAYTQLKGLTAVRSGELTSRLGLNNLQEKKMLSRLARAGVIVRLKRGVYLVPPRLPLGGVWNPGEYLVLREIMKACNGGRYQMCGWQTFNRYSYSEQIPTRISVYNNRLSGKRNIGGQEYTFIKVSADRLGDTNLIQTPDGVEMVMPTRARTLMDAVYDWSRFGTLPAAFDWIRQSVKTNPRLAIKLADTTCSYGNQGTIRRIGWILSDIRRSGSWREDMKSKLRSLTSLIPLVPNLPAKGDINREWGIIANE